MHELVIAGAVVGMILGVGGAILAFGGKLKSLEDHDNRLDHLDQKTSDINFRCEPCRNRVTVVEQGLQYLGTMLAEVRSDVKEIRTAIKIGGK